MVKQALISGDRQQEMLKQMCVDEEYDKDDEAFDL